MRRQEVESLERPYSDSTPLAERFADALGLTLPCVRRLHGGVFGDFDDAAGGVGWWAPHPGTSRRILISDHLLACIEGLETNLIEARLHLMELRDFRDREDQLIAHAVRHDHNGVPSIRMPERVRPLDDLSGHMIALHVAGFLRGIGSALDCLGATIVGVLALPASILRADLSTATRVLERVGNADANSGKLQTQFAADLSGFIAAAGPQGWLSWATDYRNMLVHRGRRLQLSRLERRGAIIYAADGRPVMLARSVMQLAQDPGLSDVEAFVSTATRSPVVTEDAATTLDGVMASTLTLSESTAEALVQVWTKRRANPSLLLQPKAQWVNGRSSLSTGFSGYQPGTVPFNVDTLVSNPTLVRRMRAAALEASALSRWSGFD
jgi:hypothetical protein